MEEKKNNSEECKGMNLVTNIVEITYKQIARKVIHPAYQEIAELKSKVAILEIRNKRLEREVARQRALADEYEKEIMLWEFTWSLFCKKNEKVSRDNQKTN